ncbi:MAG: hypothetical protein H6622_07165 [Halobacteriovoraceae bacterium]|nr:hypothetical protein [Halobacteriovoraceae bacterium]
MKNTISILLFTIFALGIFAQETEQPDFLNSQPIDISGTVEKKKEPVAPKEHPMVVRMENKVKALKRQRQAREKAMELKAKMKMEMIRIKKTMIENKKINQTFNQAFSKLEKIDSSLGGEEEYDDFDDLNEY